MDQFMHLLDPHPNWIHQPNVLSQVPFHKGIHLLHPRRTRFLHRGQHQVNQIYDHGLLAITQQTQLQS